MAIPKQDHLTLHPGIPNGLPTKQSMNESRTNQSFCLFTHLSICPSVWVIQSISLFILSVRSSERLFVRPSICHNFCLSYPVNLSLHSSVCSSESLFVRPSICHSVWVIQSICLFILSVHSSECLFVHPSICHSVWVIRSICLIIHLSIHLSVCLSVPPSVILCESPSQSDN